MAKPDLPKLDLSPQERKDLNEAIDSATRVVSHFSALTLLRDVLQRVPLAQRWLDSVAGTVAQRALEIEAQEKRIEALAQQAAEAEAAFATVKAEREATLAELAKTDAYRRDQIAQRDTQLAEKTEELRALQAEWATLQKRFFGREG
jgi:aminoglycoside phosphotransferase (APT) family kinase protein